MTAARETRFRDLFGMAALVWFTLELLCFHVIVWLRGSVMLAESNKIIIASEIGLLLAVAILGLNMLRRLWRGKL